MQPIPREVAGQWYPVPCPQGVSLALSFPTAEVCAAFCDAVGVMQEAHDEALERQAQEIHEEHEKAAEEAGEKGYDRGHEEGLAEAHDDCEQGKCPGYDVGWSDGYWQSREVAA